MEDCKYRDDDSNGYYVGLLTLVWGCVMIEGVNIYAYIYSLKRG